MNILSTLFLMIMLSCMAHAQTIFFHSDFSTRNFPPSWKSVTGNWKIENGAATIETRDYDQLLASSYYIANQEPFTFEVTLRGIRAGIYFSSDDTASKNISHMIRFDEKSILTGYMKGDGNYVATNVFDVPKLPTEWTTLRIDVFPRRHRYEVRVDNEVVGVDTSLVFPSGYIGLQASEGTSEFKEVKITAGSDPAMAPLQKIGKKLTLRHIGHVRAKDKEFVVYDPESRSLQTIDDQGILLHSKKDPAQPDTRISVRTKDVEFRIVENKVIVTDLAGKILDSLTTRLSAPVELLYDSDSTVLVVDDGAAAVSRFHRDGRLLKEFDAASIGGFLAPRSIDTFGENKIVVADYDKLVIVDRSLEEVEPIVKHLSPGKAGIEWKRSGPGKPSVTYAPDGGTWTKIGGTADKNLNTVTLSNLQPMSRYSYKIYPSLQVIPPDAGTSREFRFVTSPSPTMMAVTHLPVLYMAYRTIGYRDVYPKEKFPQVPDGRTLTGEEIEYLKQGMAFNSQFYFRNSSCKVMLDFDFYVVDDTLWLHEIGDKDPYWLSPNDRVMRDYEKAAEHFGRNPEYYVGVIVPYAWVNYPPRRTSALRDPSKTDSINIRQAYGGGTNGVPAPWRFGKTTGYTGNPFQDRFSRQDWLITHEFHHQIDALMEASGYPQYYHADQPWRMPGRFGEDFDFNAQIVRNAQPEWWLNLKFGRLEPTNDADHDGFPDDDPSLPFDEHRLGGNPKKIDTDDDGLDDLQEVMAGTARGSLLSNSDSDGDGLRDGRDPEPLYPINPSIPKEVVGAEHSSHLFGVLSRRELTATLYLSWDDNWLFVGYHATKAANLLIQIDANDDGWFHGFDNFQIRVSNKNDSVAVVDYYLRDCASWTAPPRDRKDILDQDGLVVSHEKTVSPMDRTGREGTHSGSGNARYALWLKIPRNTKYGLDLTQGERIAVRFGLQTTDDRWVWEELFERNYMMEVQLH